MWPSLTACCTPGAAFPDGCVARNPAASAANKTCWVVDTYFPARLCRSTPNLCSPSEAPDGCGCGCGCAEPLDCRIGRPADARCACANPERMPYLPDAPDSLPYISRPAEGAGYRSKLEAQTATRCPAASLPYTLSGSLGFMVVVVDVTVGSHGVRQTSPQCWK